MLSLYYRFSEMGVLFHWICRTSGRLVIGCLVLLLLVGMAHATDMPSEALATSGANMTPEGAQETSEISDEEDLSSDPGWKAHVSDLPRMPERLIVVDKSSQRLFVYKHNSPLKLQSSYICTTGQRSGDKKVSGDRRTPEGVYFVVTKIDKGLNFEEYGGIAHTLNYPNPVDRLRGKTGYGIWIHSRGRPITPQETKGCIAVNLQDIGQLGNHLPTGTAVVVADTIVTDASIRDEVGSESVTKETIIENEAQTGSVTKASGAIARLLENKTREWNAAWAARSSTLFDYYWPEAYSRAQGEPFQIFRAQKEKLFRTFPWIQILYGDIQVLQGPDYWVTWFAQYYRAPNLSTEGIRRLYWQPDSKGELRIVGMEWIPQDMGMETVYLENITASVTDFIERWRKAWQAGDTKQYATFYASDARQGERVGLSSIVKHKETTWRKNKPTKVALTGLRVMVVQGGVKADMTQIYSDSSGYRDKGVKTVWLHPKGNDWRIVSEDWSVVP